MPELFAVVESIGKTPICPCDNNTHPDQGCMVYASKEAAEESAVYQNENYGDELNAIAVPLSEVDWSKQTT